MNKKNKGTKKPFFANFLEHQVSGDQKENAQGGITLKYPSDQEEDGNGGPMPIITRPALDNDGGGDVTLKYPSDDDEAGDLL